MIDYYERINLSIEFMEKRLTDPIQVSDVSAAAFSSRWHFQRIFRYMTGFSVYQYLRNRRLAEAAHELLTKKRKVIDLALKYQYESPEAFSRAFKKMFGVGPANSRKSDELSYFERIDIHDDRYRDIYPDTNIRWETRLKNETRFLGRRHRTSMRGGRNTRDMPRFWGDFMRDEFKERIPERKKDNTLMSVFSNWDFDENFDVTIGAEVGHDATAGNEPGYEMSELTIPARKYMVFTVKGYSPEDLMMGWKYIYGTWMPNTMHERDFGLDFDLFDERFQPDENAESEIYIPIK